MFELRKVAPLRARATWLASTALHAVAIGLAFSVAWRVGPRVTFIRLTPPVARPMPSLPPYGGTRPGRGPSGGLGRPVPLTSAPVAAPAPVGRDDSTLAVNSLAIGPHLVTEPSLSDARIWVAPRPALPGEVADALYRPRIARDSLPRDTIVVRRLRAMVDSMNKIIDVEQREHRLPSWTTAGGGKKFGLDSSGIYIAGVKIPAAVLMALGSLLPQGNFDEGMRARELAEMREDMVRAARRTQTLQDFRRYVRELRARKQEEHDAARRQRGDSVPADTARAVP